MQGQVALQELGEGIAQRQLVGDGKFDVDAFDAVAVVAHARQRDHHVLVYLEGVGVLGDRGGAGAVEPEFLARLGTDGDEALARARVGHAHHFRGGAHHGGFVVADDIADQHHLRPAVALCLRRVADRLHVAFVEVFEAREDRPARTRLQVFGDLDDGRHGIAHLAEKFEADGAHDRRHLVQDPHRRGDDAVAAFLLHAGQAGEELVGDVLAQPGLAEGPARDAEEFFGDLMAGIVEMLEAEGGGFLIVDLAQVVADALHFQPLAVGGDHLPRREVVERRAPQHGLLAAGVHGDIAADTGGVGRGRVAGEHQPGLVGAVHDAARDDADAGADRRVGMIDARQHLLFDRAHVEQLFGVDHRRLGRQRHGAAGVAGAAAARDDGQAEFDQAAYQRRDLGFAVGIEHDEGILDAPVGGVGDMRDAGEAVEGDVVATRVAAQELLDLLAQRLGFVEPAFEVGDGLMGGDQQLGDGVVTRTAFLDFGQPVAQRADQRGTSFAVGEQVILKIRVAAHDPDVAQHLVEHARRAAGDALAAQFVQHAPGFRPEQTDDDLAVRERGVVVGDFAQAGGHGDCGEQRLLF